MEARVDASPADAVFTIAGPFNPTVALQFRARLAELAPEACVCSISAERPKLPTWRWQF